RPVMALALVVIVLAFFLGALLAATVVERQSWRSSLIAFRLSLPRTLTVEDVTRWLSALAATTHPLQGTLFVHPPIILETLATEWGITHHMLAATAMRPKLMASIQANLSGARLEEDPSYLDATRRMTVATEFTMTSRDRPLTVDRAESVSAGLLAALQ